MPTIEIRRPCCVDGYWKLSDGSDGTLFDMIAHYAGENAQLVSYSFQPDDPRLRGTQSHGAMGTVTIVYTDHRRGQK